MRHFLLFVSVLIAGTATGAQLQFSFGDMGADGSLTNFHAELLGGGGPVAWKLLPNQAPSAFAELSDPSKTATSGSVLAQTSQDPTDERFPMYIYEGDKFRNFRFSTQFKLVSGTAEQMAGLVFRFQNTSNFYVVRVSGLGKNVRFYKVVNGVRGNLIGVPCTVEPGTWHQLAVQCDGIQIAIWLDGKLAMLPLEDSTFSEGKLGFWTKSDAVTYFANAAVDYTPIVPAVQVMVNSVLRQEPRILGLQVYALGTNNTTAILASKDPSEKGQPGTEAELAAIQDGTISFGRDHGTVLLTMPLHDRNGDVIGAVRLKLKSFLGETQKNALGRATLIMNIVQNFGLSADELTK